MTSTPVRETADVTALAEEVVSLLLANQTGDDLDLEQVAVDTKMVDYLRRAFEAPFTSLIERIPENPDLLVPLLRKLLSELAVARADVFMMKATMTKDKVYASDYVSGYGDPLLHSRRLIDDSRSARPAFSPVTTFLPFDDHLLASGWYGIETASDGRKFRWMGAEGRASVVLPLFGPGNHEILFDYEVLDPDQMTGLVVDVNGIPPADLQMTPGDDGRVGNVRLRSTASDNLASSFQILNIKVSRSIPVTNAGASDSRAVGLKTFGFHIRYYGPTGAPEGEQEC